MPTPRSEIAAAPWDGRISVLAGTASGRGLAHEEYDPVTDRWTNRAPVPVVRDAAGRHHPGAAAIGGAIYLVGGYDFGGRILDSLSVYLPTANAWEIGPPLPTPRGALAVATVGGLLYAVGGVGPQGNTGALEVFDPRAGRWGMLRPMPTPRDHFALVAAGGRLYAVGGRVGSMANNLAVCEEYDPTRDVWTTRRPMPTARSGIAGAALRDRVYIFGGENPSKTFDENEEYDPAADTWTARARMPAPRHGLAAVTVGEAIYVLAGGPTPGGSETGRNEAFAVA